jgi:hypothetical protein
MQELAPNPKLEWNAEVIRIFHARTCVLSLQIWRRTCARLLGGSIIGFPCIDLHRVRVTPFVRFPFLVHVQLDISFPILARCDVLDGKSSRQIEREIALY